MTGTLDNNSNSLNNFYEKTKDVVGNGLQAVRAKYNDLEAKHPTVVSLAKKVAPYAVAIFSLICNPFSTLVGLAVGFTFAAELKPLMTKIKNSVLKAFNDMNVPGKILMGATGIALVFFMPGFISSFAVGTYAGTHARNSLSLN